MRPSSIAAMRTLRANGEAGEKVSFMKGPLTKLNAVAPSLRAKRRNPLIRVRRMDCFVACDPRNDDADAACLRRNDLLALLAEPVDAKRHDVAGIEVGRRLHAG